MAGEGIKLKVSENKKLLIYQDFCGIGGLLGGSNLRTHVLWEMHDGTLVFIRNDFSDWFVVDVDLGDSVDPKQLAYGTEITLKANLKDLSPITALIVDENGLMRVETIFVLNKTEAPQE